MSGYPVQILFGKSVVNDWRLEAKESEEKMVLSLQAYKGTADGLEKPAWTVGGTASF